MFCQDKFIYGRYLNYSLKKKHYKIPTYIYIVFLTKTVIELLK